MGDRAQGVDFGGFDAIPGLALIMPDRFFSPNDGSIRVRGDPGDVRRNPKRNVDYPTTRWLG
jgi:hypothetical protein